MGQPSFDITEFRFKEDSGKPGTTWIADQNDSSFNGWDWLDTTVRVRFEVQNNGNKDSAASTWQLSQSTDDSTYGNVTTVSSIVRATATGNYADGDNLPQTDQQLGGAGNWQDGFYDETGSDSQALTQNYETEVEFSIQFLSSDIISGTTVYLQVYPEGVAPDAATNYPAITFTEPARRVFITHASG